MDDTYAPPEYVSIPERGIHNAFVVHLKMDGDCRRRLCDGRLAYDQPLYDRASGHPEPRGQVVLCRACQIVAGAGS